MKIRSKEQKQATLEAIIKTVSKLRAPDGCPWDKEQTHQSLRPYLIEESYELLDVLDQIKSNSDLKSDKIKNAFKEELGDVLLQVLLHSELACEQDTFDFYDVAETLNEKLIRRHPHVFSDAKAETSDDAFKNWEKLKAEEKKNNPKASVLDGVPSHLPALQKSSRIIEKATKVGFKWSDIKGPLSKINEELSELTTEINQNASRDRLSHELGDLLFSVCNLAFMLKIEPEGALRSTVSRFQNRFQYIERKLKESKKSPEETTLEVMDQLWEEAKLKEK